MELDPNYATAHHWFGNLTLGTPDQKRPNGGAETRGKVDPLSLIINTSIGIRACIHLGKAMTLSRNCIRPSRSTRILYNARYS